MSQKFESELTGTRAEIAAVLEGVVDGLLTGSIRLGDGPDPVTTVAPDDSSLEIELETEGDELSLELQTEWSHDGDTAIATPEEHSVETEALRTCGRRRYITLARFEVYRDGAEE